MHPSSFISDISRIVFGVFNMKNYYKTWELSTEHSTLQCSWRGQIPLKTVTSITSSSSRVFFACFSGRKSVRHFKNYFSKYQTKSFPAVFKIYVLQSVIWSHLAYRSLVKWSLLFVLVCNLLSQITPDPLYTWKISICPGNARNDQTSNKECLLSLFLKLTNKLW